MSKFSSENKGRSGSRGAKTIGKRTSTSDDEKKNYKAKRSFTKNKNFREDKYSKPGEKSGKSFAGKDDRKPFKKEFDGEKPSRSSDKPKRSFEKKESYGKDQYSERPRRSYQDSGERKSFRNSEERPSRSSDERSPSRDEDSKPRRSSEGSSDKKSYKKTIKSKEDKFAGFKKATGKYANASKPEKSDRPAKRRLTKPRKNEEGEFTKRVKHDEFEDGKAFSPQASRERKGDKRLKKSAPIPKQTGADGLMRLNKYLSNAGVASRRDADNLIISGTVKVNGVVVDKLGTKISPTDKVTYGDAAVRAEKKVYLLLNKPKDYITTVDDPKERKTVMELVKGACRERIYPVGRLDRNTTGLLLFTNDGEMTTKLTHPKFGVKKIYQVSLNKGLKPEDFKSISEGLELEDGIVKADDLAFVGEGKKEVGIEIHSGRNRIVRRIFEHLGYDVLKLDRVVFAGLTKKDLPRGKHRFLTAKEISFLQMIG
jgi:23S rRNA pseudouridine2605 synthase